MQNFPSHLIIFFFEKTEKSDQRSQNVHDMKIISGLIFYLEPSSITKSLNSGNAFRVQIKGFQVQVQVQVY